MSSTNTGEEMAKVIRDQDILGAEGNHEVTMHSSENEESEQDQKVDEALLVKSGEGIDSTKDEEEMDVNDSTPKVGDDKVKPTDKLDEPGIKSQEVSSVELSGDKELALDEFFESNEGNDNDEKGEDLEQYLDVLMMDSTMSVVKAMKCGDLVLIVPCPNKDHKVNLNEGKGFFMVDLAEKARITLDKQLELADFCHELIGCTGYIDCEFSLADAIETDECPEEVFCTEGEVKHLARTDSSCVQHSRTTTGNRQIIINLIRLQSDLRRASN